MNGHGAAAVLIVDRHGRAPYVILARAHLICMSDNAHTRSRYIEFVNNINLNKNTCIFKLTRVAFIQSISWYTYVQTTSTLTKIKDKDT